MKIKFYSRFAEVGRTRECCSKCSTLDDQELQLGQHGGCERKRIHLAANRSDRDLEREIFENQKISRLILAK